MPDTPTKFNLWDCPYCHNIYVLHDDHPAPICKRDKSVLRQLGPDVATYLLSINVKFCSACGRLSRSPEDSTLECFLCGSPDYTPIDVKYSP